MLSFLLFAALAVGDSELSLTVPAGACVAKPVKLRDVKACADIDVERLAASASAMDAFIAVGAKSDMPYAIGLLALPHPNRHALSREAIDAQMAEVVAAKPGRVHATAGTASYDLVRIGKLPAIRWVMDVDERRVLLYGFQGKTALHQVEFHTNASDLPKVQAQAEEILATVQLDAPDDIADFGKPLPAEQGLTGKPREILIGLLGAGVLIYSLMRLMRIGTRIKDKLS
jgi:hypothetical protein